MIHFRVSSQRTRHPRRSISRMNSSRLPANSMTASTVVMSRNFQLSPRTAARYSPVRSPLVRRFC